GIALGVAGRSAPISGLEHAVSHLLDMAATVGGRPVGRHGAQVGVAAAVAAAWWARTLGSFDPERIVERGATLDHDRVRRSIEAAFGALDPSGAMAAECWREVARKLARWREAEARRRDVAVAWEAHRTRLAQLVCAPDRIVAALRAAGAPARFSELDPPVPPETVRWAFRSACLLRERFGVADLDWLAGGGSERDGALDAAVEAALDAAGSAGGGL
ncbi:MAG TPA: hypothetical protein VNJ28_05795, partial [Candidatus Limnocylindrales bacterium]|nr:hypothetical protein [Candidatus Limnocylindrales bacterium]